MSGIFNRLEGELEKRKSEGGVSLLELRDMPPGMRKIMRLMVREVQLAYPAIQAAMAALPEKDRLAPAELVQALENLTQQDWLIPMGKDPVVYQVNLRRRAGSKLVQVWGALDKKIAARK